MKLEELLKLELFDEYAISSSETEGAEDERILLRVPGGWIIDGVFVPEPFKGEVVTGIASESFKEAELIRDHVIKAQEVLLEWGQSGGEMSNADALDKLLVMFQHLHFSAGL